YSRVSDHLWRFPFPMPRVRGERPTQTPASCESRGFLLAKKSNGENQPCRRRRTSARPRTPAPPSNAKADGSGMAEEVIERLSKEMTEADALDPRRKPISFAVSLTVSPVAVA